MERLTIPDEEIEGGRNGGKGMNVYGITPRGFGESLATAETAGKAKYKIWLKSANDAGYWETFGDFCKDCRVRKIEMEGGHE